MADSGGMRPDGSENPRFATTQWSLIAAVGTQDATTARAAMEVLCQRYWLPLYLWLRRSGDSHEDAQDLVQAFLTEVIELRRIHHADPQRGRFRTFLLASLKNFRANFTRQQSSQKRGGATMTFSLDFDSAAVHWTHEPYHEQTPDVLFDRKWALRLIELSVDKLETLSHERGRGDLFKMVKPFLTGIGDDATYQTIAQQIGMTTGAVKVSVHRWREQLRATIREEIRQTVLTEEEIDRELDYLLEILSQ